MKAERCALWWDKWSRCVCDIAAVTWRSRLVTWISLKLCWLAHQNSHSQVTTYPAISSTRWRVHKSAELARIAMQCGRCDGLQLKSCRNLLAARGASNALPGSWLLFLFFILGIRCERLNLKSSQQGMQDCNSFDSHLVQIDKHFFLGMQIRSPQWRCLMRVPVRRCYRVCNISTWWMYSTSDLTNFNS